ncbi:MAG: PaaI family thioesterase [Oscillospiraceae bacterium]|nr:PaaI family thioesterase [Oscillospiraceae bacterium]
MDSFNNANETNHLDRLNAGVLMQTLHMSLTRLELDRVEGKLEVRPDILNPYGYVHGGILATLADTVAGVAAASRGGRSVTLSNTLTYLRPATGRVIYCIAEPQRVGKTISVFQVNLTNEEGALVATGLFTFHIDRTRSGPLRQEELPVKA